MNSGRRLFFFIPLFFIVAISSAFLGPLISQFLSFGPRMEAGVYGLFGSIAGMLWLDGTKRLKAVRFSNSEHAKRFNEQLKTHASFMSTFSAGTFIALAYKFSVSEFLSLKTLVIAAFSSLVLYMSAIILDFRKDESGSPD